VAAAADGSSWPLTVTWSSRGECRGVDRAKNGCSARSLHPFPPTSRRSSTAPTAQRPCTSMPRPRRFRLLTQVRALGWRRSVLPPTQRIGVVLADRARERDTRRFCAGPGRFTIQPGRARYRRGGACPHRDDRRGWSQRAHRHRRCPARPHRTHARRSGRAGVRRSSAGQTELDRREQRQRTQRHLRATTAGAGARPDGRSPSVRESRRRGRCLRQLPGDLVGRGGASRGPVRGRARRAPDRWRELAAPRGGSTAARVLDLLLATSWWTSGTSRT